jgi:hypothetical protein
VYLLLFLQAAAAAAAAGAAPPAAVKSVVFSQFTGDRQFGGSTCF